jgi:hypothetical protein
MDVKVTRDSVAAVLEAINSLTKNRVLIGIPEENAERDPKDGDKINNAQLLFLHEHGAPASNIPARPTLIPGVKAYQQRAIERLKKAGQAAMDVAGRQGSTVPRDVGQVQPIIASGGSDRAPDKAVMAQFNAIGLEAVVSVKKQFTEGELTPLKPATIAARKRAGFEGERPLVRTGDLMRHISYVIRKTK